MSEPSTATPSAIVEFCSDSIESLITDARENPARPIIDKLLNEGDWLLVHGYEETFKSQFVFQMADAIATGMPFLGELQVSQPGRVGIVETEMKNPGLGERLAQMYRNSTPPENVRFLSRAKLKEFRRTGSEGRMAILRQFVEQEKPDVVILDVVSDFFREGADPSRETHVARLFDQLELLPHVKAWVLIRHDSKPKEGQEQDSNLRIRGSSEWKEGPDTILHLTRPNKQQERVRIEVGKLRYGRKPVPFWIRWDRVAGRLVPNNPVPLLLSSSPLGREQLIEECGKRYGTGKRTVDKWLAAVKPALEEHQDGHKKIYTLKGQHLLIWRYDEGELDE